MLAGQLAHQSTLADGGETNETTAQSMSILPFRVILRLCRDLTYTLATPVRATSKPAIIYRSQRLNGSPERVDIGNRLPPPPPPPPDGVSSSRLSFASFAFSCPSPIISPVTFSWSKRL